MILIGVGPTDNEGEMKKSAAASLQVQGREKRFANFGRARQKS